MEQQENQDPDQENQEENAENENKEPSEPEPEPEYIQVPFTDSDFENRIPIKSAESVHQMEDLILSLKKTNVIPLIISSGILYGNGEVEFLDYVQVRAK